MPRGITGPIWVTVPCRERVNLDPGKGSGEFTRSSLFILRIENKRKGRVLTLLVLQLGSFKELNTIDPRNHNNRTREHCY